MPNMKETHSTKLKRYQRVNLTNDFMFKHCFCSKEILKPLLEELWNKEIGEIIEVVPDHRIQLNEEYRSVVCDIYVRDSYGDIYILEMQQWPQKELRKRSVCYQSISIFEQCTKKKAGDEKVKYSSVSECYITFLCCFDVEDVFLKEEFPNLEQVPKVIYRSNNMMFVNLKNYALIENERLQELFKFILNSDISLHVSWYVVQLLWEKVRDIRRKETMAETFYVSQGRLDERYDDGKRIGILLGKQKGRSEGIQIGKMDMIQRMYEDDMSVSMIAKYSGMNVSEVQEIIDQRQYVLTR
ncbi:MAG: Rpn family recombination-promoting nuclease/putative transposase [Erysipelotrichaceae bacterium]|nr:Rpn family recombination-promoting nuclease/putative transposase [Erysipelotrichaceae bacterium]